MTARDLAERLRRGDRLGLLDVREPTERAFCALPAPPDGDDLHIPLGHVAARLDAIRDAAARGPLVVYCHHGVRSAMVVEWLARQGVAEVSNLDGGIDDWSASVDPALPRY